MKSRYAVALIALIPALLLFGCAGGRKTSKPGNVRSMQMYLESNNRGGMVEFVLHAERVGMPPEEEYLPTGEDFVIEIRNDVGELLWSSSDGKVFTQAIGPVEPDEIGEEAEFRVLWDGRSRMTQAPLSPGTYRVTATIPAEPQPYTLREEFTWGGR